MSLDQRVLLKHFKRNQMHIKLAEEDEVISTLMSEVFKPRKPH